MSNNWKVSHDRDYVPRHSSASPGRVKQIAEDEDIVARAIENGRKNQPRIGDTQLDETQRAIIDRSFGFITTATRVAENDVTETENKLLALMPRPRETPLEEASIKRAVAEANELFQSDHRRAYAERHSEWRNLRAFEEANRLPPRSAHYKNDILLYFSSLLLLILGEGVFNAFLFADLQDAGLIGGFFLAAAVGLANVALGFGCGFFGWRLLIHINRKLKALGIFATALLMTAGLALHLALGELREAISHDPHAQIDFLVILKPHLWLAYTSIPPAVLFVVGIATFFVAALKGRGGSFGVHTPYWGHDTMDRRFRDADADLQDAEDNLKAALANAHDSEREKLRARHEGDCATLATMRELTNKAHGVANTLSDSVNAEIARCHAWLKMYRDANMSVRTARPPAYFEVFPDFAECRATRLDLSELHALLERAEKTVAENAVKLAQLEETTLNAHLNTLARIKDDLVASEGEGRAHAARDDAASFNPTV